MTKYSLEEEIKIKAQKARSVARYMYSTRDLVEDQIIKAQEKGFFDNLEGAGKEIKFEENPYEPPELRMVFKLLKDNNFAPYWIELGKEIDADLEAFWKEADYFKRYCVSFYKDKNTQTKINRFEKKKAHFYYECKLKLQKLNDKINNFNLHCPTFRITRGNLNITDEMNKVVQLIEAAMEEALRKARKQF